MPHIEIDVNFLSHPKVIRVKPLGQLLFIRSLIYCCQHLTDGIVPVEAVPLLSFDLKEFDGADYRYVGDDLVAQLLKEKLWHTHESGYEINDYLEWQLSRAEVEDFKERKREAGRRGGQASAQASAQARAQAQSKQELEQNSSTRSAGTTASGSRIAEAKSNPDSDSDSDSDSDKKKKEEDQEAQPARLTIAEIKARWNLIHGVKPCKKIEGALLDRIKRLIKDHPPDWWNGFLSEIEKSNFLCGRATAREGRKPFRADLDWATGPINLGKILSGKYDDQGGDRSAPPPPPPKTDPIARGQWKQQYGDPKDFGYA